MPSSSELIAQIYDLNPGLCEYGVILPAGLEIKLPDYDVTSLSSDTGVKLWD